ncbi:MULTISPECIES: hypothetical protein [unclassified Nostoc]|uniref:hypothetical protein n=1 Tax=Nostoc sp. 'Peltigera membranacea cyanobiont' 232 TaxID=2014531 RepID=UPI000B954506|nr:hypothetical protein [Nostoc sp. 'Peltigera membranacea cyanobiont' 232]OYD99729.1 hypothetical protein CDG79_39215 [Nostoc sp. 'Peltigera membranacea cyanobiont' 232]
MAKRERTFISIEIDPTKKADFVAKVKSENKNVTEVLTNWIDGYLGVAGGIDVVDLKKRVEAIEQALKEGDIMGESAA